MQIVSDAYEAPASIAFGSGMRISVAHADKDKRNPLSSGFMEMSSREAEGSVYDYFSHEISIVLEGAFSVLLNA